MFQFPGFASHTYEFSMRSASQQGLPHSDIFGSKSARNSPKLFAACHVLHRLSVPRHPPNALKTLDRRCSVQEQTCPFTSQHSSLYSQFSFHQLKQAARTLRCKQPLQSASANLHFQPTNNVKD